jgi:hypothetical protein
MKKALIRILCLLLGVNVFTACYGPYRGPETEPESEMIQQELEALEKAQQPQVDEPEEEPQTPNQE